MIDGLARNEELLTGGQVLTLRCGVLGHKIAVQVITDDELRGALSGAGLTPGVIEGIVGMTAGLRDDFTPEQPRSYVSTTPTTLAAWATENLRL